MNRIFPGFIMVRKINCFKNATDDAGRLSTKKSCMKRFITLLSICCGSLLYFSCTKDGSISGGPTTDYAGGGGGLYAAGGGSGSSGGSGGGSSNPGDTAGRMTAGEWNDLENWSFWKTLMQKDT